ncbi:MULTISPECIES: hypothetical protein [Capnocytophaga]|uniref:hypothetical protein n=1 Tax=Capnocytophaga TaxID=1016 RepID=UPI001EE0ABAC|nr:hypothetical protein [Capnocytophaga canimorsus]GJQ03765.1 hypothetical protein CAPN009_01800 [Capnocytophaga canimorsus]
MNIKEENKEVAVITTKFVLENQSPIVSVFYDDDGEWQFFGIEEADEADAKVVSMKQILELDYSLNSLPSMEKGQIAHRKNKDAEWIVEYY